MDREKQIGEIGKIICGMENGCDGCMWNKTRCNERNYAEEIYKAGYRKQSEVVDEFVKRLKEEPIKLSLPLFGLSTKDAIEEYFNDIMLEVRDAINRVAKEMKGGAENDVIH